MPPTAFSPVVKADVRLMGQPDMLGVDVRFNCNRQLDQLIHALTELRKGDAGYDHVHLQDSQITSAGFGRTEVIFYCPKTPRDAAIRLCVAEAARDAKKRAAH